MNLLHHLYESYKDIWLTRKINRYKGPVYYRMTKVDEYDTEISLIRYYPFTKKWQQDSIIKLEFLAYLEPVEDLETITNLEAEYALFILIRER